MTETAGTKAQGGGYRVLARKYRPRDFSDLIGQEAMVRTLTNAFETGRIAQAWMLTGVRGVGKTTTARILARALNYRTETVDRPSIRFDGIGEHCQAIMEGRHVDVIEMDAASHTGIDDIREIIEQVRYAPVAARYKVYIIDEVHMLSMQAFNGLLKTLEEPPPHVKFIFATTEIRKVPITVLSRCQRFDLRRVEAAVLADHLRTIAGKEGITVEDAALSMIARAAEGSVRDALSLLDQAIAHGGGGVTAAAVQDMLGLADRARIIDLFEKLMAGEVAGALLHYRALYDAGADPGSILAGLAEFTHLVTRLRFVPTAAEDAALTEEERRRGQVLAGTMSVPVLSRAWQMLLKGLGEVQTAPNTASAAEMVLIRIAHAADLPTLDEALKALDDGAGGAQRPAGSSPPQRADAPVLQASTPPAMRAVPASSGVPRGQGMVVSAMRLPERQEDEAARPASADNPLWQAETAQELPAVVRSLADIAALADRHRDLAFKVALRRFVRPVSLEPGRIEVSLAADAPPTLLGELSANLARWTGRRWVVSLSRAEGGPTLAEEEAARRETAMLDARADPAVAAILARFPGAQIIDIRIPEAADPAVSEASPATQEPGEEDD
jgi:DNA polymerase-3 subunit gamma/tau